MEGLVEQWARQVGWKVCRANVIVEGASDVTLLEHAAQLYEAQHGIKVFGNDLSIIAAGMGDDGGVDGVNRRLNTARDLAGSDRTWDGALQYRFIGLFDNDEAGRRAITRGANFDRRLVRYRDLFLLHPVMPLASGADGPTVEKRATELNRAYRGLDWEIEDLLADEFFRAFESDFPSAVRSKVSVGGRTHRELTLAGKGQLRQFVRDYATMADVLELIRLICALRNYLHLQHDHIRLD